MKTLYASGYARVCVRIGVLPPPSIGERFSKRRASTGYPVSWRWRRINLHSRGFQFTSTAANSNDNTGSSGYAGRWSAAWTSKASPRGLAARVQRRRMQISDYKLKLSLEGARLVTRVRRMRSGPDDGISF